MREIKFRAWDKRKGMMKKVLELNFKGEEVIFDRLVDYEEDYCDWLNFDDCELMQFTGLKDKNGKEIYEGDIINCQWNIDEGTPGRVVKWITECLSLSQIATFALFDTTGGFTYFDGGNLKNTNIVQGNIYENPELAELFK